MFHTLGRICVFLLSERQKMLQKPHAGKQLNLPREKDPDDCIKYVWVYIIWKSNQNVNFTRSEKSNWFHVQAPLLSWGCFLHLISMEARRGAAA